MDKLYNYIQGQNIHKSTNETKEKPKSSDKKIQINNVKNRILQLSPTVREGLERESNKDDFYSEGDKAIGKGAFGQVWKVRHKKTDKVYVIKVMNKQNIIEQRMTEHINLEVEILYKINHPHIIKLYNHYEDDDNIYLIMQYANKGQLYSHLKKQGRFDQRTTAQYLRELISALKHLHSFDPPIIHRDIKPENILLDESGRIKLADFGWSNYEDFNMRTTYCGTPEYLAPEMIKKEGHDTMVDIWDVGVLMFELLVGKPPFTGNGQVELLANIKKNKISWPDDFPPLAKNLLSLILKINPKERIGLNEILNHYWFEKNPPLRPVLTEVITDPKILLESFLINKSINETTKEDMNKVSYLTKKKRMSILDENKNNNIHKINNLQGNDNKNEIEKEIQDFKSEQKNNYIDDELSGKDFNIPEILKKNEIMKKEIIDLNIRFNKLDSESKVLRSENLNLKEKLSKQTISFEMESNKTSEELNKLNMDRLNLLAQIEEKNNEIVDKNKKITQMEAEKENDKEILEKQEQKIKEIEELLKTNEIKLTKTKEKIEELQKEKANIIQEHQIKIENLQSKLFNFSTLQEENFDFESNTNVIKIYEFINGNLNDFEKIFKKGIENLEKKFSDLNQISEKSDKKMIEFIEERHSSAVDIFRRINNTIKEEIQKLNSKNEEDSTNKKTNERMDWMKKQINELMSYKIKFTNLEENMKKIEKFNKKLEETCELLKYKAETLEKVNVEKDEKINKNEKYIKNLEARLSDVKDYMFNFHSDKLEDILKWYKF